MGGQHELLTIGEVAGELRCSKAHVCNAISGRLKNVSPLPAIAMGRRKLVRRSALDRWLRANEGESEGAILHSSTGIGAVVRMLPQREGARGAIAVNSVRVQAQRTGGGRGTGAGFAVRAHVGIA